MDNAILHQQIRNLARTDGLTGLLNHRTFMEKLNEEYRRIDREGRPFSVLLMDIDKFKNVNDTYGHPVGDVAIKAVAKVLKETVRTTDFVARYGGEEFAVGMVDSGREGARQMAERVRSIMEKTVVTRIGPKGPDRHAQHRGCLLSRGQRKDHRPGDHGRQRLVPGKEGRQEQGLPAEGYQGSSPPGKLPAKK